MSVAEAPAVADPAAGLVPGLPVGPELGGQLLFSNYRNTQQAIATQAATAIHNLWTQMIDPAKFNDTWTRLDPVVSGIVDTHYGMTAANAAEYYGTSRVLADNPAVRVPGVTLDPAYLAKEISIMGEAQFYHYLKDNEPDAAAAMTRDGLAGTGIRLVMNGGRDTITQAAQNDPLAKGWERVIEPGACSFCAMLAGRGTVYKASTVDFRAHDHCHCVARSVFVGQESVNSGLSAEWAKATKGTHGAAARAAWDKHWSGKNVESIGRPAQETAHERPGHAAIGGKRK
jgi:hypothetical protein